LPILPEVRVDGAIIPALQGEYSSAENVMSQADLADLLARHQLRVEDNLVQVGELLR
jgi:hypothetical protein